MSRQYKVRDEQIGVRDGLLALGRDHRGMGCWVGVYSACFYVGVLYKYLSVPWGGPAT